MSFEPSSQQKAYVASFADGESTRLDATAGSGKTTAIALAAQTKAGGLAVAFGKEAAGQLQRKCGNGWEGKTAHSIGYGAWTRQIGRRTLNMSSDRLDDLLGSIEVKVGEEEGKRPLLYVGEFKRTLDLAKSLGYAPPNAMGDARRLASWDEVEASLDILGVDSGVHNLREVVDTVLRENIKFGWQGDIDFNDMIWLPAIYRSMPKVGHTRVIIDEAQDISNTQLAVLSRIPAKQRGIVGDPHQAIYGWRGAGLSAMDDIEEAWKLRRLPLTVSFRCPQAVVSEARKFVSHIESAPSAAVGEVNHLIEYKKDHFTNNDAVICRFNKPLFQFAFWAIGQRMNVTLKGDNMLAVILRMLTKLSEQCTTRPQLANIIEQFFVGKIAKAKTEQAVAAIEERRDCTLMILDEVPLETPPKGVGPWLQAHFASANGLHLYTGHGSKGLEWHNTFLLDFDDFPRPGLHRDVLQQEMNLKYVMITRAKQSLNFITSSGRQK